MFVIFLLVLFIILTGACWYRIAERLGYDGIIGLLLMVPVVGLVVMVVWAVNDSPNQVKLHSLEKRLHQRRGLPASGPGDAEQETITDALSQMVE